jgi:hypothetical protein
MHLDLFMDRLFLKSKLWVRERMLMFIKIIDTVCR